MSARNYVPAMVKWMVEEECTKQLLAYENHCYPNQIHVHTEMR